MSADMESDAAEYVLGTLPLDERLAFGERMRTDAVARASVAAWEQRFAGLTDRLPAVTPPAAIWIEIDRVLNRIAARSSSFREATSGEVVDLHGSTLQRAVRRWRGAALAASALAAALLVTVAIRELRPTSEGGYIAAVTQGGDKPAFIVRVDLKTRRVSIIPVAASVPAGRSLELWYIGAGAVPRSLGLVDRDTKSLALPSGYDSEAATLAVSVEPPGGSQVNGPTGPVVYSGQLIKE